MIRSPAASKALALVFGLAVAAAILLAIEAVRAYRHPFPVTDLRLEGDWPLESDDQIGFVPAKSSATLRIEEGLRYRIFTDRRGARVSAAGRETPAPVDLLTVGGSFSWGSGLDNEETFTSLLGRRLDLAVANFAFGSYGTVPSLLLLERNLDLTPRVVVYGFITDHIRRNLSPCAPSLAPYCLPNAHVAFSAGGAPFIAPPPMEYFSLEQNRRFYRQILMRERFGLADVLWRLRIDLFRIAESSAIDYPRDAESRARSLAFLVDRMAAATTASGARLVVVYIPLPEASRIEPPPPELGSALAGRDLVFIDLEPALRAHYAARPAAGLALPDGHPNARAHRLIAGEIERRIGALDPSERGRPASGADRAAPIE